MASRNEARHSCSHCRKIVLDFSRDPSQHDRLSSSRLKLAETAIRENFAATESPVHLFSEKKDQITLFDANVEQFKLGASGGCLLSKLMLAQLMLAVDATKSSHSVLGASLLTFWDGPMVCFGYPIFNQRLSHKDGALKRDIDLQLGGQSNGFEVVGRTSLLEQ